MSTKISLAMIVRDEADNLPTCLETVWGHVDEIIIVDMGSSHQTVELAQQHTSKIYHYPWQEDFSAARNSTLTKATGD